MDIHERLLTPNEAGEILALSSRQVVKLARQGILLAVYLPGHEIRFSPADLQTFIDAHRQPVKEGRA